MNMHVALQKFEEATSKAPDEFLDGILFSQDCGVICSSRWTRSAQAFNVLVNQKILGFTFMQGTLVKTALTHLLLS